MAYYFTGSPHFEDTDRIRAFRGFKRFLIHTGYTVIDKEVKITIDEKTREKIYKANLDVDITFHMLVNMGNFGEMVLLGGNSDFVPIIQHLRNHGKTVICVGRRRSTALELINAANVFIDLNNIRKEIEKIRGNS